MPIALRILLIISLAMAAGCDDMRPSRSTPEQATGYTPKPLVTTSRSMIVAAHPLAAEAGREILRAGGSAIDAAVTVQLVLGLVEPQSSGLGGGAFILAWDAASKVTTTYDGRETAPAAARPDRFIRDGRPLPFGVAVRSGLSVGVPGAIRALETAHKRHGRLPWKDLFAPARKLAAEGFPVGNRLHKLLLTEDAARFAKDAQAYFFENARPHPAGSILRNPEYARTLDRLAAEGADALYSGPIGAAIVQAVASAERFPGDLTMLDLASYRAIERPPICAPYRAFTVCGMGPPSSGGIAVGQALMLLDGLDPINRPASSFTPRALHLIGEALKLAYADRNWYIADPSFVPQPDGLLDASYIAERRQLISPWRTLDRPYPGLPRGRNQAAQFGNDATIEATGTSHISIVDEFGNAVAMTTTIEAGFGSGLWAAGFLLNNQLTDFSFRPRDTSGRLIANRIEPGKRPRSSMSPTIVLGTVGRPLIVTGSPGGSRIISYVTKTLVGMIDLQLDAARAAALPNLATVGNGLVLESQGTSLADAFAFSGGWLQTLDQLVDLKGLGQSVWLDAMTSGIHTIARRPDGRLDGGADPRREGVALGD